MKRSRQLKLSLLGVAPLVLTACGASEEELTYEKLDDCLKEGKATPQVCSTAYNKAMQEHLARSPRFSTRDDCAGQYGNCQYVQSNGQSFWLPLMAGFLAGRWSSSYGNTGRPYLDTYGAWSPRPLYRSRQDWDRNTYSTIGGYSYSDRKSGTSWSSGGGWGSKVGKISTSTLSRGGFGGSSIARGGWGGS